MPVDKATQEAREVGRTEKALHTFLLDNDGIEKDATIRRELKDVGIISKREADDIETQLGADDQYRHDWELWLKGSEAATN